MTTPVPDISVILPVYNSEKFLREAIESILNQSFRNFELIIINDGSSDNSEAIIQSFSDERIVYVRNEKNLGLIATLNRGIKMARASFIARMDNDDIALQNRLKKQFEYLVAHPEVAVVATRLIIIDENGKESGYWNDDFETRTREEIATRMPKLNCIGHPTVMMRKDIITRFGYDRRFRDSEDWGLWLTLLSNGYHIDKIDETLLKYRVHEKGTTVLTNQKSVSRKIIAFKFKYLTGKIVRLAFKIPDLKVLKYLLTDIFKYYFRPLFTLLVMCLETRLSALLRQRREFDKLFDNFPEQTGSIFFFPFYHLGGAEIVHSDIVRTVAFTKPVVIFTSYSGSDTLLSSFKKYAHVLIIDQLIIWPFTKRKVIKKILGVCQKRKHIILFSSNSRFFYELLGCIPQNIKAIDLIHAFMHPHEDSAEKWSLPVVDKLYSRVVINQKTANDFAQQYKENQVSHDLLKRVIYISNFVERAEQPVKSFDGVLKVLYVGRGTPEKRVHLIAGVAKKLKAGAFPLEFHFVGDVFSVIPEDCHSACVLHGEVRDKAMLNKIYSNTHILAMASTREGFPMVIMEAMMHGVVPITTNVGGISQHVEQDVNGILINEGEAEAFCEAFEKAILIFLSNRNKLKMLSENAYKYALDNFTEEKFVQGYTSLFSNKNGL